ncbi:MAG TPA: acetylxylan esterase [Planctomycetota bacterium]|nr:acetylxylan esterase [Planctomycetota bacterium]
MSFRSLAWILAPLVFGAADRLRAQDGFGPRRPPVVDHLKKVAAELTSGSLADVGTLEDWKQKRPGLRRQLLYMLGLDPLPERTPLEARTTGILDRAAYRIEKLVFQSRPGLYVTGNFYVPKKASGPLPTILYVCGHAPHPRGAKVLYQDRASWFADHGYACLILDTLEFGEVPGPHHGLHDLNRWDWLSRGYTPAGVEVWNALRAVDYLETRPEVDRARIGLTGISGGGATTWFAAAVDDRIAAAAPCCSTYTIGSQAAHWVAAGQCDCIYFHNTFLVDFPLVGALIAPRPLLILSGRRDPDFPPDGYHEVFRQTGRIFGLYGVADRVKEVDDDCGHSDIPLFLKEARQWMQRWLREDATPLEIEPPPQGLRESAEDLACLDRPPAEARNATIHDQFVPVASRGEWKTPDAWEARRTELLRRLREEVFRAFPKEKIEFRARASSDSGGWGARYADFKEVVFESEPGVPVRARLFKPRAASDATPLLVYVKRPGDSIYPLDLDELLPILGRYTVLILNPRLTELAVSPREYADLERSASWVGRTVGSMQVWDILRAVEWVLALEKVPRSSVTVYGKGDMGVLGLYAALFDERISRIVLENPPESHRQGPALLNVLRVTDIPEAAAALAPRPLVVLGPVPPAFEWTRRIYGLRGAAGSFVAGESLPQALEAWKY